MNTEEQERTNCLYKDHVNGLILQGKSKSTIAAYSYALKALTTFFDRAPDTLEVCDLKIYFVDLILNRSWSVVKIHRSAFQFFYLYVINRTWEWVEIIKPPRYQSMPDILASCEVSMILNATRELRFKVLFLVLYTMGLRVSEALKLCIGDIDSVYMRVHIRNSKGNKDRFVTLPERTLLALREFWVTHRHERFIFPNTETRRHCRQIQSRVYSRVFVKNHR
jgi:integrase/recombinase XerD